MIVQTDIKNKVTEVSKTSRRIIRGFALLSVIVISFIFLVSCQPTPKEAIIVNKGNDALENAIAATPAPKSASTQTTRKIEATNMVVREHWKDNTASKLTTVNIDADVLYPNVAAYPIFEVSPIIVDQKIAEKFVNYARPNAVNIKNGNILSKDDLKKDILMQQKEIADIKAGKPADSRPTEEQIAELEGQLKETQDEYNKLIAEPDTSGKPLNYTFEPEQGFKGRMRVCFQAQMKKGGDMFLCFEQCSEEGPTYSLISMYDKERIKSKAGRPVSSDKARALALDAIKKLDIGQFDFASEVTLGQNNELTFYRSYDGIPVTCITGSQGNSSSVGTEKETNYSFVLSQECLRFRTDDSGIVYLSWGSPCNIVRTVNENVSLKPFTDIKNIFKKQILYNIYEGDGEKETIGIDKIRLGYMVIPEKDDLSKYHTIPVWDFIGPSITDKAQIEAAAARGVDLAQPISYLTVNAIDGSIIDRKKGY